MTSPRIPERLTVLDLLRLVRLVRSLNIPEPESTEPLVIDRETFDRVYEQGTLSADEAWALLTEA